jgi:hypothetical protein
MVLYYSELTLGSGDGKGIFLFNVEKFEKSQKQK